MSSEPPTGSRVDIPDAPAVRGLAFRRFRGESDFPAMLAVIAASKAEDREEWSASLDDVARTYRHLVNCDPPRDMLFAEVNGEVVGYGRVWWEDERKGDRIYPLFASLIPQLRDTGIRRAVLRWLERRAASLSEEHPTAEAQYLQAESSEYEHDWQHLLETEGYRAVRWGYEMVRSLQHEIPVLPLPGGIELRPATDADAEAIFKAAAEAFADHWGESGWFDDRALAESRDSPTYDPSLWKVAWEGGQIVGMVLNFRNDRENEEYQRKRGYTETICVRRPWRGRGIAKALITCSLQMWRQMGMTEAAHGVDTQNPTGALQLYESLGYRPRKTFHVYRKILRT